MCSTYDRALRPPWPLLGAHEHVYFTYDRALAALLANPAVSVIRMIVLLRLSWPLQGAHNHSYSTYDRDLGAFGELRITCIIRMIVLFAPLGHSCGLMSTCTLRMIGLLRHDWPLLRAQNRSYFFNERALAALLTTPGGS